MTHEVNRNYSKCILEKKKMKFKRLKGINIQMKAFSLINQNSGRNYREQSGEKREERRGEGRRGEEMGGEGSRGEGKRGE